MDHTEYMVSGSFIWTSAMFVSQGPTPAIRPSEWTLSSVGEPCLSAASWLALRVWRPSHVMSSNGASMVLTTFAETKVARLPGRTPATQKSTVIREFGTKLATHSPSNASQLENLKIHSDKHDMALRPEL